MRLLGAGQLAERLLITTMLLLRLLLKRGEALHQMLLPTWRKPRLLGMLPYGKSASVSRSGLLCTHVEIKLGLLKDFMITL